MAVNCVVEPAAKLAGGFGDTAIDDSVGAGVVVTFDVQLAIPMVNKNINPIVRQKAINRTCFLFIIIIPLL
jgi:hypothetical protein